MFCICFIRVFEFISVPRDDIKIRRHYNQHFQHKIEIYFTLILIVRWLFQDSNVSLYFIESAQREMSNRII